MCIHLKELLVVESLMINFYFQYYWDGHGNGAINFAKQGWIFANSFMTK
jgi:hypothetical protein